MFYNPEFSIISLVCCHEYIVILSDLIEISWLLVECPKKRRPTKYVRLSNVRRNHDRINIVGIKNVRKNNDPTN